jgi:hypothetical protein
VHIGARIAALAAPGEVACLEHCQRPGGRLGIELSRSRHHISQGRPPANGAYIPRGPMRDGRRTDCPQPKDRRPPTRWTAKGSAVGLGRVETPAPEV